MNNLQISFSCHHKVQFAKIGPKSVFCSAFCCRPHSIIKLFLWGRRKSAKQPQPVISQDLAQKDPPNPKLNNMATVKSNQTYGPVANGTNGTNSKPTSNGEKPNGITNFAYNAGTTTKNGHHEESSNVTVTRSQTRERSVKVTRKYDQELTVLCNGTFSKPDSVELFLDFVAADRLRRMPHRGSRWDKILRWAEYFTIQVSILEESVRPFVYNSEETAQLVWASCRILLEVGLS